VDHLIAPTMADFAYVKPILEKLRTEKTAEKAGYNLVKIRDIPQNPTFNAAAFEDVIDNFETRDGDVFISTFVKAGTTWTQQIIHQILRNGEEGGFYGETVPWLEAALASDFLNSREAPTWDQAKLAAASSPRYFKTHATVDHLPRGKANIKIIYIARNPKDSCVSLFHHAASKPEFGFKGDFNAFCEMFLTGQAENGDWFDHVLDWYNTCLANPTTHLFLQYEDMYLDNAAAVQKIATFLGHDLDDPVLLAKIVKNSTLTAMKETSSFGLNHLRKGGYGGWRSTFTVAMSEFFDDVYRYRMAGSGLAFNFGPNAMGIDQIV
jgi:hypothetical protein